MCPWVLSCIIIVLYTKLVYAQEVSWRERHKPAYELKVAYCGKSGEGLAIANPSKESLLSACQIIRNSRTQKESFVEIKLLPWPSKFILLTQMQCYNFDVNWL